MHFHELSLNPVSLLSFVVHGGARRLGVLPAVPAPALRPGGLRGAGLYTQ